MVQVRVLHSDVGKVDEGRLQLLASIVAFLVQVTPPGPGKHRYAVHAWVSQVSHLHDG